MAITDRTVLALVLVCSMVVLRPQSLLSCGPFFPRLVFTYTVHPDFPPERFAAGELGVLLPTYARSYLAVAYRYLVGPGLDTTEQHALMALWRERLGTVPETEAEAWPQVWLEARNTVPDVPATPAITVFRAGENYSHYLNCPADAFRTAASTLQRLQERFGADSPAVRNWVQAQDAVFAACSNGAAIDLPPATEAELQHERAYQMAAAQLYSGHFDAASAAFAAIAQDMASPWHTLAPYLVARTLVRKATLHAGEGQADLPMLAQAEAQVRRTLGNSELHTIHPAAQRLLRYIRFRSVPQPLLAELSQAVLAKGAGAALQQTLADYTLLLDKHLGEHSDTKELTLAAIPAPLRQDTLSDWILTLQASDAEALTHALGQWEATSALPWLVAVLSKIDASHAKAGQLLRAAAGVPPTSPGFATVAFHQARLLLEAGKKDEARTFLDSVLARGPEAFPVSARNMLRALRMQAARTLEEFLMFAQRLPSGVTYDEDGRELPEPLFGATTTEHVAALPASAMQAHFDTDTATAINQALPLSLRKAAANHPALPAHLRRDLTLTTWVAAALLDQVAMAQELAPGVASQVPELKADLDAYLAATTTEAKKAAAVFLFLKFPGTRPYMESGIGRLTPLGNIDNFRDNWWCAWQEPAQDTAAAASPTRIPGAVPWRDGQPVHFLTEPQKAAAQAERQKLRALDTGPNYLVAQVLAWARRTPDDPRLPEALHLAVRSTRFGCTNDKTSALSRQAYQVLHKQYANSPWAQKTKYWY